MKTLIILIAIAISFAYLLPGCMPYYDNQAAYRKGDNNLYLDPQQGHLYELRRQSEANFKSASKAYNRAIDINYKRAITDTLKTDGKGGLATLLVNRNNRIVDLIVVGPLPPQFDGERLGKIPQNWALEYIATATFSKTYTLGPNQQKVIYLPDGGKYVALAYDEYGHPGEFGWVTLVDGQMKSDYMGEANHNAFIVNKFYY